MRGHGTKYHSSDDDLELWLWGDGDDCSLERYSRETAEEGDDVAFCTDGDKGDAARRGTPTLALQRGDENALAFRRGGASAPIEAHGRSSLSRKRWHVGKPDVLQRRYGASKGGGQTTRLQLALASQDNPDPSGVGSAQGCLLARPGQPSAGSP